MRFALALASALALSACATSASDVATYDAALNETVYQSPRIPLGRPAQGGIGSAQRITLQAEARCPGEACAPEVYQIALSRTGEVGTAVDYDRISFETDQGTISFGSGFETDGSAQFYSTTQGEFTRLAVPADIYRSFAEASTLTIRLGGSVYALEYGRRAALRRLLPDAEEL